MRRSCADLMHQKSSAPAAGGGQRAHLAGYGPSISQLALAAAGTLRTLPRYQPLVDNVHRSERSRCPSAGRLCWNYGTAAERRKNNINQLGRVIANAHH